VRFLSLFSGIEAASVALEPLGWECVGVCEIEPFPCSALRHHWPRVPNMGDVTQITEQQIAALGRVDVVIFGSPCQDLSVAGKRKGLDGERSGLFFTAMDIVGWLRKHCGLRFAWWENVPGAFTSNDGADFGVVVGALAGCAEPPAPPSKKKWGTEGCIVGEDAMVEWSTLDAQWFGVAQRRRRVFAVADFGDWRGRPPILLEPESLRGDSAPRREAGEGVTHDVAPCLTSSGRGVERSGDTRGQDAVIAVLGADCVLAGRRSGPVQVAFGGNNTSGPIDVGTALNASGTASGRLDFESETFVVSDGAVIAFNSNAQADQMRFDPHAAAAALTLRAMNHSGSHANAGGQVAVAFQSSQSGVRLDDVHATLDGNNGSRRHNGVLIDSAVCVTGDRTHALTSDGFDASEDGTGRGNQRVATSRMKVRRLTPRECERLQDFPDDHTLVPHRGKPAADGPRYKALGNSMCVAVIHWIGQRIDFVHHWFGDSEYTTDPETAEWLRDDAPEENLFA
jgi:DNA (cytosine-5)-methyltransferase 1